MACKHKFKDDLTLNYIKGYEPEILIVGTFNPEWTDNNSAEWFYGRTENNYFWSVLPKVYKQKSMLCKSKSDWQFFCKTHKIAITDLIENLKTAELEKHRNIISNFSDKAIEDNFKIDDLDTTNIIKILQNHKTIKYVYLTRSAAQGLWKKLWKPVQKFCSDNQIVCKELLTPSGYAFYQFKKEDRLKFDSLSSFITNRWEEKWHKVDEN